MTTVTLPREVVAQAHQALEGLFKSVSYDDQSGGVAVWRLGGSHAPREAIKALRTALDAPAKPVDCMTCRNFYTNAENYPFTYSCGAEQCTDFDKFQALPPIVLTKVTK